MPKHNSVSPDIKVIALGWTSIRALHDVTGFPPGFLAAAVCSDSVALRHITTPHKILFPRDTLRNFTRNRDHIHLHATVLALNLAALLENTETAVIATGFGYDDEAVVLPDLLMQMSSLGMKVLVVGTAPEGIGYLRQMEAANNIITEIDGLADEILIIRYNRARVMRGNSRSIVITDLYQVVDGMLQDTLLGIKNFLVKPLTSSLVDWLSDQGLSIHTATQYLKLVAPKQDRHQHLNKVKSPLFLQTDVAPEQTNQSLRNHKVSFEKEDHLHCLHHQLSKRFPELYMWRDFMDAVRIINPKLAENAFERRPCRRRLRYIGRRDFDGYGSESLESSARFIPGEIYYSTTFNGATYEIDGESGRAIGSAYFEWVPEGGDKAA